MPQYNTDPRNTPNYDPRTGQYHADTSWRRYEDAQDPSKRAHPLDALVGMGEELWNKVKPSENAPAAYQAPVSRIDHDIDLPDESMNNRADAIISATQPASYAQTPSYQGASPAVEALKANAPRVMPGAASPNEAMRTFTGGSTANQPLELARMRQEALDREESNYTPNQAVIGLLNRDIAEDPFTGEAAQAKTKDIDDAITQANLGGYRTPQEAAEEAREQETYKVDAPVRAQQLAGQYDLEKQRVASQGAIDVAKTQQEGIASRYGALQDLISGGGLGNIRGFNPQTGGVTFGAEGKVGNTILDAVTNARREYETLKQSMNPFKGQAVAQAKAALDAAVASALSQHPADATLKEFTRIIASDPNYAGKTLPEILQLEGEDNLTPQELNDLQDLFYIVRGQ